ncbi:MAG TPA: outer membrane lipoprotein chaperone LolA [Methylothermaceae bacterium]|nr:outer membrane lipoprotein chaperone LolA [Methylothermaceae bacterium]
MAKGWISLAFLWLPVALAAAAPVNELERFLASVTTLSAEFEQTVLDEQGKVSQKSMGHFYLKRPGKFRWTYEIPFRQEVVADGNRVWFYDPDLEQVTVRDLDEALGSAPALLLSGKIRLTERFRVKRQGREGKRVWIELQPKSEEDVFRRLRVELESNRLVLMELADHFGQLTRIRFRNMVLNPELDDELFRFQPPPGIDVFEG